MKGHIWRFNALRIVSTREIRSQRIAIIGVYMARPRKKLDADLIKKLAHIHCTVDEIASICGCSKDTLERRYMDVINEGRASGKSSLRRLQWEAAQKGNATMQIWLGKQILDQKDKPAGEDMAGSEIKLNYNLDDE